MYTVVRYRNIPLNSGSLWEHPQILQILRFRCRSDRIHPVFTKYKLIRKQLKNTLILHFFQDGSDSVLTLFTPAKTVSTFCLHFLCNLKSIVRFTVVHFRSF